MCYYFLDWVSSSKFNTQLGSVYLEKSYHFCEKVGFLSGANLDNVFDIKKIFRSTRMTFR